MDLSKAICSWCAGSFPVEQLRDHQFDCEMTRSRTMTMKKKKTNDRLSMILEDMSSNREKYMSPNLCKKCGQHFQNLQMLSKHSVLCDLKSHTGIQCNSCGKRHDSNGDVARCAEERKINSLISNTLREISTNCESKYKECSICHGLIPRDTATSHTSACFDQMVAETSIEYDDPLPLKRNENTDQNHGDDEIPLIRRQKKRQIIVLEDDNTPLLIKATHHLSVTSNRNLDDDSTYRAMISAEKSPTYVVAEYERRTCTICDKIYTTHTLWRTHQQTCIQAFLLSNKELFNRLEDATITKRLQRILGFIQKMPFYMPNGTRSNAYSVMSHLLFASTTNNIYGIEESKLSDLKKIMMELNEKTIDQIASMLDTAISQGDDFLACLFVDSISMMIMGANSKLDKIYEINKTRTMRNNILNALWYNMEEKISDDPYTVFNMLEVCLIDMNTFLLYEIILNSKLFSYLHMDKSISMLREDYKYLYRLNSFCPKIQEKYNL